MSRGICWITLIGPFFIDGNLNATKYEDMLLVIRQIVGDNFARTWFQQDGVEPHYNRSVRNFLDMEFPNRWIGRRGEIEDITFIWSWLLFVGLTFVDLTTERQSVCNKTKKFRWTLSKNYWRSCTHWIRIHQKCRIQFLWSNSLLPMNGA